MECFRSHTHAHVHSCTTHGHATTPHHTTHNLCVLWCSMRSIVERGLFRSISGCRAWSDFNHTHLHYSHICVNHTHSHYPHIYTHIIHTDLNHTHSHYSRTNHRHAASTFFFYRITDLYCQGCVDMCGLVCVVVCCIVQ